MKTALTLTISHNIHLKTEQRKKLASGDSISAVGVSVPVWYFKGKTNEPAEEIFCSYIIHNHSKANNEIYFKLNGYEFNLPQLPENFVMPSEIDNQEWLKLTRDERNALCESRYVPVNGLNLRDVKEGGSGKVTFERIARAKIKGVNTTIHHTIHIADIVDLQSSLC